ncbi:hypothetical protein I5412_08680 [Citrobacter koseri]|uniref:hypothetical protein n=1 Tax=Citrobacter koseri TaxID=545 RepID=UPI0019081F16|nr:hypothetical protein [Citrobacter koseri]MBJ8875057.1 hypothetical protein [Citrobacter koseri]
MIKLLVIVPLLFSSSLYAAEANVGQICKAAAASMFGRDHKIMKLDKIQSDVAYVHYIRKDDSTRWAIKCKLIDDDQVMWASNNPDSSGRWRNDPADSVVKYKVDGNKLTISEVYSDGSRTSNSYPLKQLN